MASQQEIIKEYLVKLGFTVDKKEQKDFTSSIETVEKGVMQLGKGLLAVAAAGVAMATSFALSMDKLFYASQKANSSASNLKALEYAGRQIGMTAEAVDQMVASMSMALRMNPGKFGLLEGLGINNAQTRQGVDVFMELMDKLHDKPMYEGAQFAEMLGVSPDQLFQIETNLGDFHQKFQDRLKMAKDAGLDQDAAAKAGRNLANQAGTEGERLGIAADLLALKVAPSLQSAAQKLDDAADALQRLASGQPLTDKQKAMNDVNRPWWSFESVEGLQHPTDSKQAYTGTSEPAWMDRLDAQLKKKSDSSAPPAKGFFDAIAAILGKEPGSLDHLWKGGSPPPAVPKVPGITNSASATEGALTSLKIPRSVQAQRDLDRMSILLQERANPGNSALDNAALDREITRAGGNRYLGTKAQGDKPKTGAAAQTSTPVVKNITINVNGAKSPSETASAVARKIDTASADLARFTPGAVR